jgi:hypothetical protein
VRLPAHFSYNEFNFSIFCACRRTLATMNSLFQIFGACRRTLATMTSKKLRLPAQFRYNEFTFSIFLLLPAHLSYNDFNFLRLPAHFSYNEFTFSIFGACRRTLATMNSLFNFCACLRILAIMTSNLCWLTLDTMTLCVEF